jgi:hydroxymethylpyrimidine/phosphomethylpyrimidine kinase
MKVALTIAGSDSGGGAGLQADLRTFAAHGLHGASAVTAVTAQNSVAVTAWVALEPAMVSAQIDRATVAAVAEAVARHRLPHLVVDPVMMAKSGDRLLDPEAERAYVELLFPLAAVVTPNLWETEALLGRPVRTLDAMREAARDLRALGPRAVVVKGGHLEGDEATDVFHDGARMVDLPAARVATAHTHGTGCTYAAAIAARLGLGHELLTAVRGAKEYLTEAIRRSYRVGRGHGPVDHLHPFTRPA